MTENGEVYSWGQGKYGQLGLGDYKDSVAPQKIESLKNIVKVDCGSEYTMALDKDGQLFVFGSNSYGQLGVAGRMNKLETPQ